MKIGSNHNNHSHGQHGDLPIHQKVLEEIHKTHEKIQSDHNLTPDERHEMSNKLKHLEDELNDIHRGRGSDADKAKEYEGILKKCSELSSSGQNNLLKTTEHHHCLNVIADAISNLQKDSSLTPYEIKFGIKVLNSMKREANVIDASKMQDIDKVAKYHHLEAKVRHFDPGYPHNFDPNNPRENVDYVVLFSFLPTKAVYPGQQIPMLKSVPGADDETMSAYNKVYFTAQSTIEQLSKNLTPQNKERLACIKTIINRMLKFANKVISSVYTDESKNGFCQYITNNISALIDVFPYLPISPVQMSQSVGHNEGLGMIKNFKTAISNNQTLTVGQKQSALDELDEKMEEMEKVRFSNIAEQDKQSEYVRIFQEAELIYNKTEQM